MISTQVLDCPNADLTVCVFAGTEQKTLGPFPISNHLKDLPYTSTFEMSPDAQLVGYLSQHTTHAILQAKPEIDALMAK